MSILHTFSHGIVNDPRDTSTGASRVVSNFDINTSPNSLIPYRSSEDGNSNAANDLMQNWCIALRTGTTYSLYGLGRQTATDKIRVFYKNLTTGAATDLDDNGWTETANNLATQTNPNYNCFVYYKNQGLIFGLHGARYIWSYDPSGSNAFGDTLYDLTSFTNCANGLVHSKDDILYIPVDNKIYSKNAAAAFSLALTLPASYYITSICENGNYIDIAMSPLSGVGESRMFRWDRSTTLTTITENINWGSGNLKILEELEGYSVGISVDGSGRFNDRVRFQYFTGAGAKSFFEILGTTGTVLPIIKQKINNRLHFMMSININGAVREGVWSFGQNPNGNGFNLIHERTPNNDTALGGGTLRGFFYVGDYLFIASVNSGAAHQVMKTDDGAVYSASSIYESCINPDMVTDDKVSLKQLKSIVIGYETLSGVAGSVVVKYKVDSNSAWSTGTTICTCTTTGVNFLEFKDAAGVPFSKGREYEFQLTSTLGAKILYFKPNYSVIPTLANTK